MMDNNLNRHSLRKNANILACLQEISSKLSLSDENISCIHCTNCDFTLNVQINEKNIKNAALKMSINLILN